MKRSQWLSFLLGLFLLVGIGWSLYRLVHFLFSYLHVLPKEIGASLIAGIATVLVATLTLVIGRYFERKKELDALYRDRKTAIYDEFLTNFFKLLYSEGSVESTLKPDDTAMFLREFTQKLILWSGPEVIMSFVKWKDHLATFWRMDTAWMAAI
jgi:hypothetical protein